MSEHIGLLVVHGIGEQKRFETARELVRSILAGLVARDDGSHFSLIDRTANPAEIPINCPNIDRASSPFTIAWTPRPDGEATYLHIHEVWWSDLGAPATLSEQIRFWLWGLGQWNAPVEWTSHLTGKVSNTDLLMDPPTKFHDVRDKREKTEPRLFARSMLFLSGLYALLTLFSWEAIKRVFSWLSASAGSPAILTSYVGDVRIYTQAPGKGGGNLTDLGQPWRATIRRRMICELVAMAERQYDRWYLLGHSLGSVVAFNGIQETAWNLPNYLGTAQTDRIKNGPLKDELWLSDEPGDPKPDLTIMMPRRPVWLGSTERISRQCLFKNFKGLITYGSPLDKFAALWPRIVPINKDRAAFDSNADWVNLSDATDPVGAQIGAFTTGWRQNTPDDRSPMNVRVKASALFLLAHIRYFGKPSAKGDDRPETRALVEVLFPGDGRVRSLSEAFASVGEHYGKPLKRAILAGAWVLLLGGSLVAGTSWLALLVKKLGDATFANVSRWLSNPWREWDWLACTGLSPNFPTEIWTLFLKLFQWMPVEGFFGTMLTTLVVASIVIVVAGIWRRFREE